MSLDGVQCRPDDTHLDYDLADGSGHYQDVVFSISHHIFDKVKLFGGVSWQSFDRYAESCYVELIEHYRANEPESHGHISPR